MWIAVFLLMISGLLTACKPGDEAQPSQSIVLEGTPTPGESVPWDEVPENQKVGDAGSISSQLESEANFSFTGTGSEAGFALPDSGQDDSSDTYPAPGAYPAPGLDVATTPVSDSTGSYPAPGVDASTSPYPGPEQPMDTSPYPGPDQTQDTGAYPPPQSSQPQSTVPAPTTVPPTPTPTPLPTPIPLDARIIATNPSTVKLASGYLQLIEFFAYWDGYSKSMAPIINELEAQYVDQIVFVRLDVDDPATGFLKSELGYELQPEFYLVNGDGVVLEMWEGLVEIEDFMRVFNQVIYQGR